MYTATVKVAAAFGSRRVAKENAKEKLQKKRGNTEGTMGRK